MSDDMIIRKARVQDVKPIHRMLLSGAGDGLLLPRSLSQLYSHVRDFYVVAPRDKGEIVACCALAITWEDIAEIVTPARQRQGWGKRLVEACCSEAVTLGIYRVFTLTYQMEFFASLGFEEVTKDMLPQKVWADCVQCPKFPECDEIAMLMKM